MNFKHKHPNKDSRTFSWGRIPADGCVTYRLFRRDTHGVWHVSQVSFLSVRSRKDIAATLKRTKRQLRDKVDVIDLEAMGIAA